MGNGRWEEGAPGEEDDGLERDSAEDDLDIQELLDLGYDQLDGFVQWLEDHLGVSTRVAQQDCFNAEALIDYLANYHHKSVSEINEYELRWFLFSHYIRKSLADEETERRLPESLRRFFEYLRVEHAQTIPSWIPGVLDDTAFYLGRCSAYHSLEQVDEEAWEAGFRQWCAELEDDLDTRALWLPRDLGEGLHWGCVMGWREAALYDEANRNWQTERDNLLHDGLDVEAIRTRLTADYFAWVDTPQERLDGQTPREVIAAERWLPAEQDETDEDAEDSE